MEWLKDAWLYVSIGLVLGVLFVVYLVRQVLHLKTPEEAEIEEDSRMLSDSEYVDRLPNARAIRDAARDAAHDSATRGTPGVDRVGWGTLPGFQRTHVGGAEQAPLRGPGKGRDGGSGSSGSGSSDPSQG